MGQDLKGRELGVGIAQRKDGRYTARFVDKRGKRKQKYFKKSSGTVTSILTSCAFAVPRLST